MAARLGRRPSANALFYQFGDNNTQLSALSVAARLIVGVLSSLIVFVPTTLLSFLFRRVRRRHDTLRNYDTYTHEDLKQIEIEVRSGRRPAQAGGWG